MILTVFTLIGTKKRKCLEKPRKPQEGQKAQGRPESPEKARGGLLGLPGPSWGSLSVVPSLSLPGSPAPWAPGK